MNIACAVNPYKNKRAAHLFSSYSFESSSEDEKMNLKKLTTWRKSLFFGKEKA